MRVLAPMAEIRKPVGVAYPPGPTSSPAVQLARWLLRPIPFLESCRRYGDAFSVLFPGFETPMVMISSPEAIKALYTGRQNGLPPGRNLTLEPIMGARSLLLLEGAEHLAHRRLMLPPFHGERLRSYEAVIEEVITAEIESWPIGKPFPIHPRMQAVTLEVIMRAVFGLSDPARQARLRPLLARVLSETASPTVQLMVLLARRFGRRGPMEGFDRVLREIDAELYPEIEARRADPDLEQREDILSALVAARFEDGGAMSDEELRDQLMTLLLAGHETTATALAWTFDLLLRNPSKLDRLEAELRDGGEEYLRAVISESLRLRPVVPLAGRRLHSDLSAGGVELEAGTDVTPAIWLTHTRADVYPEPFAFRPERFVGASPDTYAWIPFGGGVRRCLGAAFAELEMRVVLRAIVEGCNLALARGRPERVGRRNVTLSPRAGTPVIVAAKRPAQVAAPVA
jgi:cytochrome P450